MTSEKRLERDLGLEVKRRGGWSIKMLSTHVSGLPDRLCLFPGGYICFAEIKSYGKKPTKIQKYIHRRLRKLGFEVYVIDTSVKLNKLLTDYEKRI